MDFHRAVKGAGNFASDLTRCSVALLISRTMGENLRAMIPRLCLLFRIPGRVIGPDLLQLPLITGTRYTRGRWGPKAPGERSAPTIIERRIAK